MHRGGPLRELTERLAAGRARYLRDLEAGRVGSQVHSRSGKDLPPHRPRRDVDAEMVRKLRRAGLSWRAVAECLGIGVGTARRAVGMSQVHPADQERATASQKIAECVLASGAEVETAPPGETGAER